MSVFQLALPAVIDAAFSDLSLPVTGQYLGQYKISSGDKPTRRLKTLLDRNSTWT